MNTPEKYVTAYMIECLTTIKGTNQERVYEVLENSDFTIEDPFLNLVYQMARYNPSSQKVKDAVAGLVMGHTLLKNDLIRDAVGQTIEEGIKERSAEKETPKREIELLYETHEGTAYFTTLAKYGGEVAVEASIIVPEKMADMVINKFTEKFPEGIVRKVN